LISRRKARKLLDRRRPLSAENAALSTEFLWPTRDAILTPLAAPHVAGMKPA
jgi:hypothetical protein